MITLDDLIRETNAFFSLYWNSKHGNPPEWSTKPWEFDGTIEGNTKRGCYALFSDAEVIYIGVGLGKSQDRYHGSGLGDRLKNYWQVDNSNSGKMYKPRNKWENILTGIRTIGFPEECFELAAALEVYLIKKLNPPENTQHKTTAGKG